MISKIFIITLVVGIASAKTIIGQLPPKPAALADKEGCYIKEINDVIPFGDSVVPLDSCHRIYCGRVLFYASEQRVKFPKKRRILRPDEMISLAGFLPNCCSLGFSIRVNSHVNFICAMQDICDVIRAVQLRPMIRPAILLMET
ncbi:hypothetical protein SFRURICE_014901 [Spodoptera frugiperda]|nr:hypothetical protein SFRURICE_014901 [Spodoptera frugiperda]